MGGVNLTNEERMLLTQLSYKDMQSGTTPCTFLEMLDRMAAFSNDPSSGQPTSDATFCQALKDDMESNPGKYPNLTALVLTDYDNNNGTSGSGDGFVGYAFEDLDGDNLILCRGTENGEDWWNNLGTYSALQKDDARRFYERNVEPGGDVLLVGHSLGGGLCLYLVSEFQDRDGVDAWVLNSAYFEVGRNLPGGSRPPDHEKVYSICTSNDWSVGRAPTHGACGNGYMNEKIDDDSILESGFHLGNFKDRIAGGSHNCWTWWDYSGGRMHYGQSDFLAQLKPSLEGNFEAGPQIRVDTAVLVQLAGRVAHAVDLASQVDRAIDGLGRTLADDALAIKRDGNVSEAIGRGVALSEVPPRIAALIARIRGEVTNFFLDIRAMLDGGLRADGLSRVDSYLRQTAHEFEATEEWLLSRINTM